MLLDQLQTASIQALKDKNEARLSVLRMVLAQLKNKVIEKRSALTEEEIVNLLRKEVKKRQESVSLYQSGNRPELAAVETAEIAIIEEYLPQQLSLGELKPKIEVLIREKDLAAQPFGLQMKAVMAELGAQADGGMVSQILKELAASPK